MWPAVWPVGPWAVGHRQPWILESWALLGTVCLGRVVHRYTWVSHCLVGCSRTEDDVGWGQVRVDSDPMPGSWSVSFKWNQSCCSTPSYQVSSMFCWVIGWNVISSLCCLAAFWALSFARRSSLCGQTLWSRSLLWGRDYFLLDDRNKYSYDEMSVEKHLTPLKRSEFWLYLETFNFVWNPGDSFW